MRSRAKMGLEYIRKPDGKLWLRVAFAGDTDWIPSFEDIFRIVCGLIHCERANYPNLPWPASKKMAEFLRASVAASDRLLDARAREETADYEAEWAKLDADYGIAAGRARRH